jgi:hypothetical protein
MHWIGGWVGPRAGLDTVAKRKNPAMETSNKVYSDKKKVYWKMEKNTAKMSFLISLVPLQL